MVDKEASLESDLRIVYIRAISFSFCDIGNF